MELSIVKILTTLFLPPAGLIVTAILGLGLSLAKRKLGFLLTIVSLISLLICSLPAFAASLVNMLQEDAPITPYELRQRAAEAEAIVLLAGGRRKLAEEYGDDTVNLLSLERARYAAWIAKRTHLPLIISGGRVMGDEARSEADLIREFLQNELNLNQSCHLEEQSRTTYENALYTAEFIKQSNIRKVVLVTHAWHMRRAKYAFEHFDIQVIPAPTVPYGSRLSFEFGDFLPSVYALYYAGRAFHEIFGHWWYTMRYY